MIFGTKFIARRLNLSLWTVKRWNDRYLQELIETQGQIGPLDSATERRIWWILLAGRWEMAIRPYLSLFKLAREFVSGQYWRAFKKVHSGADETSSTSTGAVPAPVAQYAGYAGGFTAAVASTSGLGMAIAPVFSTDATAAQPIFVEAGIQAGEVTAYRCWALGSDGLLRSVVYHEFVWQPGAVADGTPTATNHAGIYAYKSVLLLHNYGSPEKGTVTGTVDLWGEIYEHTYGYRAQYAAIASIDDSPYYDAAAIRKRYGLKKPRKRAPKK